MTDTDLTLAWVNGYRAAKGQEALDELPENRPWNPRDPNIVRSSTCPVAAATGLDVVAAAASALDPDANRTVHLPHYVVATIWVFDRQALAARWRTVIAND